MREIGKLVLAAATICSAVWALLLFGLGNIGLQRSVTVGPQVLLTEYPLVTVASFLIATGGAALLGRWLRIGDRAGWPLPATTLVLIAGMSWLVAPVLIGELEFEHGSLIFLVLSVVGVLPFGVLLGSLAAGWWTHRDEAGAP
jgi:hypothetical protein